MRMGNPDNKGYYRIIGVDPSASAEAIKKAYRRRSKELHPDTNQRMGAELQFQALTEAYDVLSDPISRARYDTQGLEREAPGGNATGRQVGAPVPCSRCGRVSAQPRYVIFQRAVGRFTNTAIDPVQGIYCSRCARDVAVTNSLFTWILGWWAWNGPVAVFKTLKKNISGGDRPAAPNHRLMVYQAQAFEAAGRGDLARALAKDALSIDPDGEHAEQARRIMGDEDDVPVLKSQWGPDPLATIAQLMPGVMLAVAFVIFGPFGPASNTPVAPMPFNPPSSNTRSAPAPTPAPIVDPGRAAHIKSDHTPMRAAPGEVQPVIATLSRFENVERLGGIASTDVWIRIRSDDLEGYVRVDQLGKGTGEDALAQWCELHRGNRPNSGKILVKNATGPHTLTAANRSDRDAIIKLKDQTGHTVYSFYLRTAESVRLPDLPEGEFNATYATGDRFSNVCATFLNGISTHAWLMPVEFRSTIDQGKLYAQKRELTLSPDDKTTIPIDPATFTID